MSKLHIKKGDTVYVNAGEDKGKTGRGMRLIIPYWKKESNQRPERIPAKDIFGQMEEVTASQRRLRNKASLLTVIV